MPQARPPFKGLKDAAILHAEILAHQTELYERQFLSQKILCAKKGNYFFGISRLARILKA